MQRWHGFQLGTSLILLALAGCARAPVEEPAFPRPRFPSYVTIPTNIEQIMPYARAAVRQTGGRTPLGLVESGKKVALFAGRRALVPPNPLVLKAIVAAFRERNIKAVVVLPRPENNEVRLGSGYTSEDGYREALFWINRWANADEPKAWLREKNPQLYQAMFPEQPRRGRAVPLDAQQIAELDRDPDFVFWDGSPREYLDAHGADIDNVFAGYGGRPGVMRALQKHVDKFVGNFIFDNYLEVMTKVPGFPGDVWRLVEERVVEPLAWVERAEVTDPEGTNFSFDLTPELARMWSEGAYLQGHLFMFPHQATGRRPFSIEEYPRLRDLWLPPVVPEVDGIIAGSRNHTGFFPRMEVVIEKGRVKEVRGGGQYGDFIRAFLGHPKLNTVQYPFYDRPGYWFLYEAGMGTNPKFFQRPDELMDGSNSSERNVAGVIHWAFGAEVEGAPPQQQGEWDRFVREQNVPSGHWLHIHNVLLTYRVRVRGTNNWSPLIERGRLAALDHPEARALASRYGDPDELLRYEWVPDIPGVTSPGNFQEYSRNPWAHVKTYLKQIEDGTYPYLTSE